MQAVSPHSQFYQIPVRLFHLRETTAELPAAEAQDFLIPESHETPL